MNYKKDIQYYKFCSYGFLKNLKFFEPFLILFFLEKGLSFFFIGILYSLREVTTNLLEIPTGVIADSIGRRRSMIFSFLSYIGSFLIFYFSNRFYFFLLAILFFSCGEAFRTGTHKAMIFEYLKIKGWQDQKVHYYGHTRASSQFGSAISALISAAIVFYSGTYKLIFLFTVIPYLLDLGLMISYPKELDGITNHFDFKNRLKTSFSNIIKLTIFSLKQKQTLKAIFNLSFFSGYFKAVKDYLQPVVKGFALSLPFFLFLEDNQKAALVMGILFFGIYLFTSLGSKYSGNMAHLFKKMYLPLNLSLLIGAGLGIISALFFNFGFEIVAILCFLLLYILQNIRKPIGIAYLSDKIDSKIMATGLSIESQVSTITIAIIAPILGFFADKLGFGYGLLTISVIMFVLFLFIFVKD